MNDLPEGMRIAFAAEINFAIKKFTELTDEHRLRLAKALTELDEDNVQYVEAALEVFEVVQRYPGELTRYINDTLYGGKDVADGWMVFPENFAQKVTACAQYFRENLKGIDIEQIAIPKQKK